MHFQTRSWRKQKRSMPSFRNFLKFTDYSQINNLQLMIQMENNFVYIHTILDNKAMNQK